MQKWKLSVTDSGKITELSMRYRIPVLAAAALLPRTSDPDFDVQAFLSADGVFRSPMLIRDMDKAAARLKKAVEKNERICIFGDYDADGVTSTAILYKYLKSLGCDVSYYIPDRLTEGYGMNNGAVRTLAEKGVELIVTVDNGISAYEQVELANSLGMEVIVTDHHTVPERMPPAVAVVDPHRKDDDSPFENFCGAGVAFKLVMAMEGENCDIDELFDRFGAELAIGTVADVVSLDDENRTAVKRGLRRINDGRNLGVRLLCDASDIYLGSVDSTDIGFGIGPRINAAGRLGDAARALRLLITEDENEAELLSQELCGENNRRKRMIDDHFAEAVEYLNEHEEVRNQKVLVVGGVNWHPGVIGLVASKLRELYGKPAIVLSIDGDKAKGSARSVEGYPMDKALLYAKDTLLGYGGHPMAAGMSLLTENIEAFREKVNEFADTLDSEFFSELVITAIVMPGAARVEDVDALSILEPFGEGNPSPLFAYAGVTITGVYPIGNDKYIKAYFEQGNIRSNAVCFRYNINNFPYKVGDTVDLAVEISRNEFNGEVSVSSKISDIKLSGVDNTALMRSRRIYEQHSLGKPVTEQVKKELAVTRDDFAELYRNLDNMSGRSCLPEVLYYRMSKVNYTYGAFLMMLRAFEQTGLITVETEFESIRITPDYTVKNVDLMSAPVLKGIV